MKTFKDTIPKDIEQFLVDCAIALKLADTVRPKDDMPNALHEVAFVFHKRALKLLNKYNSTASDFINCILK